MHVSLVICSVNIRGQTNYFKYINATLFNNVLCDLGGLGREFENRFS